MTANDSNKEGVGGDKVWLHEVQSWGFYEEKRDKMEGIWKESMTTSWPLDALLGWTWKTGNTPYGRACRRVSREEQVGAREWREHSQKRLWVKSISIIIDLIDDPRDKWKHFKRWWGKEGEEDGSEKAIERMGIWGMTVSHEPLLMNKDKGHDEIFATVHKAESDREGGRGSCSEAESLEFLVNSYWRKCILKKGNLSQIWAHSGFL